MSDTPEVDEAEFTYTSMRDGVITGEIQVVGADFARRLERERDALGRKLAVVILALDKCLDKIADHEMAKQAFRQIEADDAT